MIRFIRDYFGGYYLLFFLSYFSIYFFLPIVPFVNIAILAASYYLIVKRLRFDVVISLILYSRCINGFVIFHNPTAFTVINLLTNVIPVLLYFAVIMGQQNSVTLKSRFINYKFTFLFFLMLTVSFLVNLSTSYDLLTKRYLPMAFFVLFLIAFTRNNDFHIGGIIQFFRAVFLASILTYFFSDYLLATLELMESDLAFSVESSSRTFSFTYFSFTRNMGPSWDHRIMAIMAYLYLLLSIIERPKYFRWDIILSAIVVVTTLSRGAIATYSLILLAYFYIEGKKRFVITMVSVGFVLFVVVLFSGSLLSDSAIDYLNSFNPLTKGNAFEQRSGFAHHAMKEFKESPILGSGVGYLSSRLINRHIIVENIIFPIATDAYWYILLAEMGIIGFFLYVLLLKEVFLTKNVILIALFLGFAIQLMGTDIPDMRFYYFAILVLVFIAKGRLRNSFQSADNTLPAADRINLQDSGK